MECTNCNSSITPGMEISCAPLRDGPVHCPYCLAILPIQEAVKPGEAPAGSRPSPENVSVRRFSMRREVREKFADSLADSGTEGRMACPVCEEVIDKQDEITLRNSDYFRCHMCCHDLATLAYRKEAYAEQRWLPVVSALADLQGKEKCTDCRYLSAIARSCQNAASWIPNFQLNHSKLLASLANREKTKEPDCEWQSCFAVTQYRTLAGAGLALL